MTLLVNVINIKKVFFCQTKVGETIYKIFIISFDFSKKNHFQFNFALCSGGSNTHNLTAANYLFYFIYLFSAFHLTEQNMSLCSSGSHHFRRIKTQRRN
jgi:hypothetical protein